MPKCQNCNAHVTEDYCRVFVPEDEPAPRCCPESPDMMREGATGKPREYKNGGHGEGGSEPTRYDPAKDPTADAGGQ